jgi:hypothetical protein
MHLGQEIRVDGQFRARGVACGDVGVTVKFTRGAQARVTDPRDARYLKSTGGMLFFPPGEFGRLTVAA